MTSRYFTYDKNKTIQALRYHFISRREIKWMIILVNVFSIITAILFYFKKIHPLAFLVSSVLWFCLMIAFWYLMPRMVYNKAATFKDTLKAIISEDEFRIETERGGRSWNWNEISSWLETPYFFHIYFNPRSFFLVPKESFDGDDAHEVRKLLKKKLG
jgi:hypothetical protein